MTEEAAVIDRRIKRACKLLFYKRHRQPGVKGWELKKSLGGDYLRIAELLNQRLESLGLHVRTIFEAGEVGGKPSERDYDRARFYITLREPLSASDLIMAGWRIDDIAALAVAVASILSKEGRIPRRDLEVLLREKFPKWKVEYNLNRFIRMGYLGQDENDVLYLDWRSRAEIDEKLLLKLILGQETRILEDTKQDGVSGQP